MTSDDTTPTTPGKGDHYDADWCRIIRTRKEELGRAMSLTRLSKLSKVRERTLDRTMNGERVPDAAEIAGIAKALDLPVLRLLAAVDVVPEMTRLLDYVDQLEEIVNRTEVNAGLTGVQQPSGASIIASRVVASGRYRATIWPLWQGTGRYRRHYSDMIAFDPLDGAASDDLRPELKRLMRAELGWFHAGFIGFPETASGMPTSDLRSVVNVPRFVAIRRGGEERAQLRHESGTAATAKGAPLPNSVCVVGLHWSGSADVGSFLAHAFDYDSSHIGFMASRAYSRLTDEWDNAYFDSDRLDVARTYFYGSQLGRRRVWSAGGDQALATMELVSDRRNSAPLVVHLRVSDDLLEWAARVRTSKGHTQVGLAEDIATARADRDAMTRLVDGIPGRAVTLDVDLPEGPDFSGPAEDGRDAFFDLWARTGEQVLSRLRDDLDIGLDLDECLRRMDAGGRTSD